MKDATHIPNGTVIYPTHACFDDALDLIVANVKVEPSSFLTLRIIHAICNVGGKPFAHAWVEEKGEAFFYGLCNGKRMLFVVNRKEWRDSLEISDITEYTVQEAEYWSVKYTSYGPWKPEYRVLCLGRGGIE